MWVVLFITTCCPVTAAGRRGVLAEKVAPTKFGHECNWAMDGVAAWHKMEHVGA